MHSWHGKPLEWVRFHLPTTFSTALNGVRSRRPRRTAFLKYHRGRFFGFDVELKGWWWCPYTVWHEPACPNSNPIIRHARASDRRNSYVAPKHQLAAGNRYGVRQLWRGKSDFGEHMVQHIALARTSVLRGVKRRGSIASPAGTPIHAHQSALKESDQQGAPSPQYQLAQQVSPQRLDLSRGASIVSGRNATSISQAARLEC